MAKSGEGLIRGIIFLTWVDKLVPFSILCEDYLRRIIIELIS